MKKRMLSLGLALVLVCALAAPAGAVTMTETIPCKYDGYLDTFHEGLAAAHIKTGERNASGDPICQWIILDETGKEVAVPLPYYGVGDFHEGMAMVSYRHTDEYGRVSYTHGYIDKTGREVIPCKYSDAYNFSEGLAPVQADTGEKDQHGVSIYKWGFIDKTGKVVVPFRYVYSSYNGFSEGLAAVEVDTGEKDQSGDPIYRWGFIDKTGREVIPCQYREARSFSEGLAAVSLDGKWGFIDKTGEVVIPFKYDMVESFEDGLAKVDGSGGLIGYVDKTGREIVPCRYQEIERLDSGMYKVKQYDKYGLLDREGKVAAPCQYAYFGEYDDFFPGLAMVRRDGGYTNTTGFLDKSGREALPSQYNWGGNGTDLPGLATVKNSDGLFGFLDQTGKLVVPCKYSDLEDLSEGMMAVSVGERSDQRWGFLDQTGKEVIPCQYDRVDDFSDGLAAVRLDGKWSFIDKTGETVLSIKEGEASPGDFSEGLARIYEEKQPIVTGYMDKTGRVVVPCKYESAEDFSEGLALVFAKHPMLADHKTNEQGFIDKTGRMVIRLNQYVTARSFSEGMAAVCDGVPIAGGKWGFIDKSGKEVIPCRYSNVDDFAYGLAKVKTGGDEAGNGGKAGLIDRSGKEIVPCQYDEIKMVEPGLWQLKQNGKLGYANTSGIISPCQYDSVEELKEGLGGVKLTKSGDKLGLLSADGRELQPCKYAYIGEFVDGLAKVNVGGTVWLEKDGTVGGVRSETGKWGFIDRSGQEVLPCLYSTIHEFKDGVASVERDGKWGFIALGPSIAYPSTQKVDVDGKSIEFQCYALKDAAGNDTNYIKLRDLAAILDDSPAQFQVGWNGQVTITTGQGYTPNGSEQKTPFSGQREYKEVDAQTLVNGAAKNLAAFTLTDDAGGGYTYYKLRDLGTALGFKVDWTAQRGVFIETE